MFIIGVPSFLIVCAAIGWLDYKLGLFQEESRRHSSLNPINLKMLEELKEIKDMLHKKDNKL